MGKLRLNQLYWIVFFGVMISACDGKLIDYTCYNTVEGEKLFVGSENCLATLSVKRRTGYVSIGPEESVFFGSKRQLNDFLHSDTKPSFLMWFDKGGWKPTTQHGSVSSNSRTIYKVTFDGQFSEEAGLYGHMGLYGAGVLLKNMQEYSVERRVHYDR